MSQQCCMRRLGWGVLLLGIFGLTDVQAHPPTPVLDVVLLLDRSRSMAGAKFRNAQAAATFVLRPEAELFQPEFHRVALGVFPHCNNITECQPGGVPTADAIRVPLRDPSPSSYDEVIVAIESLTIGPQLTDLATPLRAAADHLQAFGRPEAKKVIILLSDGAATELLLPPAEIIQGGPCNEAFLQAERAKNLLGTPGNDETDFELFTIGYDLTGQRCLALGEQGPWVDRPAAELLAAIASQPSDADANCQVENTDRDHYLCQLGVGDLQAVFATIVASLLPHASVGGSVTRLNSESVICWNLSTGHLISFPATGDTWNCEAVGLVVNPGDRVFTGAEGIVP